MTDIPEITGSRRGIMRRLFSYAKPYWPLVLFAILSLAIGTAADLAMPVVIQRAVDNELIARYSRFETTDLDQVDSERFDGVIVLGAASYVPENQLVALSGVDRRELTDAGLLGATTYHVFPLTAEIEDAFPDGFSDIATDIGTVGETRYASVDTEIMDTLTVDQRRVIRAGDIDRLGRSTRVFLVLLAAVLVFSFLQIYLMALVGQGVMKDMRLQLFGHTIRQRMAYLSTHPVGRLVTRVTNDVETVNQFFTEVLINLLRNIALMLGSVATLIAINWRLGLVALATLPPAIILTLLFRTRARNAYRRVRKWVSKVNGFLSEHLSGMSVVQLFARENKVWDEFTEQNEQLKQANLGEMYVFATFRPLIDLLRFTSTAVVIYFGARFLLTDLVSLGVLIAFINLIGRFYQPVMSISEQFTIMQSALAGSERVFEMLDDDDVIPDTGTYSVDAPIQGRIEFDNVTFEYKSGEPVIRGLSFTIEPGETVAIVGYTGAGKTTIANLLTRMWDIQGGRILLDGVDIREYPRDTLRTVIQPIQQDVFLFSDTVAANIALGRPVGQDDLERIGQLVQAEFVERLPQQFESKLTEGATNISTGERQLLSFARILAHDPRIIVMDEATANIDTETEQLIQKAVSTVMEGRTSLVIAHRLSTIKNADRIMVLAEGKLVESGTHDELISEEGLYYNLYKLQYTDHPTLDPC